MPGVLGARQRRSWGWAADGAGLGAAVQRRGGGRVGNGKAPGTQPILGERERAALRQVVEEGPTPAIHGVVRWRIVDLMQWL